MRAHRTALLLVACACGGRAVAPAPAPPADEPPATPVAPATPAAPVAPKGPAPVVIADAPPAAGEIGTAGRVWLPAVAPDGSWVIVCQARKDTNHDGKVGWSSGIEGQHIGDDAAPYLVRGDGPGEELDALVAADPNGRYLVVMRGKAVELLEVASGTRVALPGADGHWSKGAVFGAARAAFDARGEHVAYTRAPNPRAAQKGRRKIVVRRLSDGAEHTVDPGPGDLRDVELVGSWVMAHVFEKKPGYRPPIVSSIPGASPPTEAGRRCGAANRWGDHTGEARWAPLAGDDDATATARPGVVGALGEDLLVSGADRSLSIEHAGQTTAIAPAACGADVVATAPAPGSVLYACAATMTSPTLHLWRRGADSKQLQASIHWGVLHDEPTSWADGRVVELRAPDGRLFVDLASGGVSTITEEQPEYPIAAHGARLLLHRRMGSFSLLDLGASALVELPGTPPDMMESAQAGRLFAAGRREERDEEPLGVLVDIEAGAALGTFPGPALAVSTTGWVLSPTPPATKGEFLAGHTGPLRWVRPTASR